MMYSVFKRKHRRGRHARPGFQWHWLRQTRWQVGFILVIAISLAGLIFSAVMLITYASTQDRLHQARQLMDEGKMAWAQRDLKALTEEQPELYTAWLYLGQCYLELNDVEQAEQAFESAMAARLHHQYAKNAKDPIASLAQARLLRIKNRYVEAEKLLTKAYELHPTHQELKQALWELYYHWGYTRLESGSPPQDVLLMFQKAQAFVTRYRYDARLQAAISEALEAHYRKLEEQNASIRDRQAFLQDALREHYSHGLLALSSELAYQQKDREQATRHMKAAFALKPELYALRYISLLDEAHKHASGDYQLFLKAEKHRVQALYKQGKHHMPYDVRFKLLKFEASPMPGSPTEWKPDVQFSLTAAKETEPIPFLRTHTRLSSGGVLLNQQYSRLQTPSLSTAETQASTSLSIASHVFQLEEAEPIVLQRLKDGQLMLEVFVSFDNSQDAPWYPLYTGSKEVVSSKELESPSFPWEKEALKTHPSQAT
jgi:tetratricopeptide (TPR) repeat protein